MSVRLFSLLHVFLLLDGANPIYAANPVRKVVNLLQNMKTKVEKEGETEKELYEKFQCYCKKNIGEMEESLKVNEAKLPPLRKNLVATEEELNKVTAQIQTAKTERQEAENGVAQAAALRRGEAESFQKTSEEQTNAIESIEQAIAALTKGMAESFLQTDAAESLRRFAFDKDGLEEMERQDLLAFLQHGSDYVPQSGQILGMLKHMGSDTREALAEAQATEAKAVQEFKELSAAKSKEIKALTTTIEEKVEDQGELKVALVRWKSDLADTEAAREEDQKVLLSLHSSCDKKASDWEARVKTRAEELLAIDETVKVLDSDDARNSLRKALPETSFLQVDSEDRKARALGLLRQAPGSGADLLLLALKGQKIGFDKVVQMIDSMKATMKKEQENEKKKKEYCKQQFTGSDDKKRGLLLQVSNKETKMESAKDVLKVMESEIQELNEGLQRLDKDVADATEQRKKEHQEFLEMEKTSGEAAQLLQVAKKRLKQFYAKPPSLVEVSELVSVPGQAPETFDDYHKADEAAGVFVLLDALIRDIEHQMSQAETEEQEDQKGYEKIMQDRSKKRESDSQSVAKKTARKADVSSDLQVLKEGKANVKKELSATEDYITNLHDECDWLLSNFQARSEAREEEVESLDRAKAVLQGAEFSFLQVRRRGFLAR